MEDKLQSLLILLKNTPDLSSDEKLAQLFEKAFGEDTTTQDLLSSFLTLENPIYPKEHKQPMLEIYRKIVLYMSENCSEVQVTLILQAFDEIVQIDQGTLGQDEFCIKLISSLLDQKLFLSVQGMEIENNSLIISMEQNLFMIAQMIANDDQDSTEVSQKSIAIMVKYAAKIDEGLSDMAQESYSKLVDLIQLNLEQTVESNKVIYIRFVEIAI